MLHAALFKGLYITIYILTFLSRNLRINDFSGIIELVDNVKTLRSITGRFNINCSQIKPVLNTLHQWTCAILLLVIDQSDQPQLHRLTNIL